MTYHFSKIISGNMASASGQVKAALAAQGFGVLTEIDIKQTLKSKLDVDFRPYLILGACNPGLAHKALQAEDKIGTMLPCNVILQEIAPGEIEVSAVDPAASMSAIENPALAGIAEEVRGKLQKVIASL